MQEQFFSEGFNDNYKENISETKKEQGHSRLFICGTNAYNPRCRYYKMLNVKDNWKEENYWKMIVEKDFSGKGFCPYDPKHNSTFIYAG